MSDVGGTEVKPATPTRKKRLSELVEAEVKPATPTRNKIAINNINPISEHNFINCKGM